MSNPTNHQDYPSTSLKLTKEYDDIDFDSMQEARAYHATLKQRVVEIVKLVAKVKVGYCSYLHRKPIDSFLWIQSQIESNVTNGNRLDLCSTFLDSIFSSMPIQTIREAATDSSNECYSAMVSIIRLVEFLLGIQSNDASVVTHKLQMIASVSSVLDTDMNLLLRTLQHVRLYAFRLSSFRCSRSLCII